MPGTRPAARRRFASFLPVLLRYSTVSLPKSMTVSFGSSDEERADRIAVVNALHRLAEETGDAGNFDLLVLSRRLGRRNGVGDVDVGQRRILDALERRAGEDAVGRARRDRPRPVLHDRAGRLAERARGVDHVVDDEGV